MSRHPGHLTDPATAPARPHLSFGPPADHARWAGEGDAPAVLIEVPAVRPNQHGARRPSETATARVRSHGGAAVAARPGRRRRRLRREIRLAGCLLASALPFVLAVALLHGSHARAGHRPVNAPAAEDAGIHPPAVSITIDPAASGRAGETEPPVVLPGYLLPDDGSEEGTHGGT